MCVCVCVTSHWDPLVLHPLPPSLVVEDGLDLVDVLRGGTHTGTRQPRNFHSHYGIMITGNHDITAAKYIITL